MEAKAKKKIQIDLKIIIFFALTKQREKEDIRQLAPIDTKQAVTYDQHKLCQKMQ